MRYSILHKFKYHIMLHFTIIIWGFTGIIGKILDISGLNTYEVVFWRMLIGWVTLFIYLVIVKRPLLVSKKTSLKLFWKWCINCITLVLFFSGNRLI